MTCPRSKRQAQNAPCFMQVALIVFLTVALLLVSAFFSYHLVLILSGMTSYESYKWTMLHKMRAVEQEAQGTARAVCAAGTVITDTPHQESAYSTARLWRIIKGRRKVQGMPANLYDRGLLRNLQDALAPPAWASRALTESDKAKQSSAASKKHA